MPLCLTYLFSFTCSSRKEKLLYADRRAFREGEEDGQGTDREKAVHAWALWQGKESVLSHGVLCLPPKQEEREELSVRQH